jgi:hypothetical protein
MAPRVKGRLEAAESAPENENEVVSQRKRAEVGRFLLQVDRQTKGSYVTADAAETAGMVIKKSYPIVQVSVYDSVESVSTPVDLPEKSATAPI